MTSKKIFMESVALGLFLLLITEASTEFFHKGLFYSLESSLIEPLFFMNLSVVAASFILLFFRDSIFKLWLKKIITWFAPLAILAIAFGSTEVSYVWPTRTSLAIILGEILVVITLVFALIQRFYYKK